MMRLRFFLEKKKTGVNDYRQHLINKSQTTDYVEIRLKHFMGSKERRQEYTYSDYYDSTYFA